MLDDVLITLTGVFALIPGAGFIVDDVKGFTEGWTAFAQVRHFSGLLFPFPGLPFRLARNVEGPYDPFYHQMNSPNMSCYSMVHPNKEVLTPECQAFENALFAVPQIGRWIFPIDSATSQVIQMAELSTQMGSIIQMVQNNLNKTLVEVMQNTTMVRVLFLLSKKHVKSW